MSAGGAALALNDPVHVELHESTTPLQGVVAFLGPVSFADGNDWVGVRLTGPSVGHGKNDGSVKGVRYFENCGHNGGVFVRKGAVRKRQLTRLEELRLKRELNKAGAGGGGAGAGGGGGGGGRGGAITPPRSRHGTSSSSTGGALSSASATATSSGGKSDHRKFGGSSKVPTPTSSAKSSGMPSVERSSAGGAKSRLDAIRERRAALAAAKDTSSGTATPSETPFQTPASSRRSSFGDANDDELSNMQEQVDALSKKLRIKEEENASLQSKLSKAEQEVHDANSRASAAVLAAAEAEEASKAAAIPRSPQTGSGAELELAEARQQISQLELDLEEVTLSRSGVEDRLTKTLQDLSTVQDELEREREGRAADAAAVQAELDEAQTRTAAVEKELATTAEQAAVRGASDATHYKERARLEAEMGGLKRKVAELEREKVDNDTTVEELTLDKEQLQEEKEALEDKVEELKIDVESAQIDVDELRVELEEAREKNAELEARGGGGAGGGDGGEGDDVTAATAPGSGTGADADDVAQALSVQNARLREALLRLREQSNVEKMDLARQLRTAEKDATSARTVLDEVETLRALRTKLEDEVRDLKEMVDQGSAFERMVEDLSDRVMGLEDETVTLNATIREMEEAAEIAAEMEEVQADENKALMRELEGRDTTVRNLEEAIKMQRRREEDFQRTVGNYRTSIETLRQEKNALLALREGGEGEKSHLLATSQKALAQAAQLVSDAANMRKREAEAAFDRVNAQINGHLSGRLESFLPQAVVSSELATVRGELLLSKVASKASVALAGVSTIFTKVVQKGANESSSLTAEESKLGSGSSNKVPLSDARSQRVATMIHQTRFAHIAIDASADALRLLLAGQWPDLLTPDSSLELGGSVVHSVSDLDVALTTQLRTLKEEGSLSPHRSNLTDFDQSAKNAKVAMFALSNAAGNPLLSSEWNPPAWDVFKDLSSARFSCMGAAAAVASAVSSPDNDATASPSSAMSEPYAEALSAILGKLMSKLDQIGSESTKVCRTLTGLNVTDDHAVSEVGIRAKDFKKSATALVDLVEYLLSGNNVSVDKVKECESKSDETFGRVLKISACLRSLKVVREEGRTFHPLSPETEDPWDGVVHLVKKVRVMDGDEEDINFVMRARGIERQLAEAVENEPKLSLANSKVASLEKSLSSRSKEIAMQNVRLAELEKLLSQTSNQAPPTSKKKAVDKSSSEEISTLKEENRVLTEAMDVLHKQVDEYEREIRTLRDPKSARTPGGPRTSRGTTPRRSASMMELSSATKSVEGKVGGGGAAGAGGGGETVSVTTGAVARAGALEAALFRPALHHARSDAALWKSKAMGMALLNLPPLFVPGVPIGASGESIGTGGASVTSKGDNARRTLETAFSKSQQEEEDPAAEVSHCIQELTTARSNARLTKASISVVDLTADATAADDGGAASTAHKRKSSRAQLRREWDKNVAATERLEEATVSARSWLAKLSGKGAGSSSSMGGTWLLPRERAVASERKLLGRVTVPGGLEKKRRVVPLIVQRNELAALHMHLLR